ncbi:MAG: hypothetical protein ACLUKN_15355 [Bacilli bacterium]
MNLDIFEKEPLSDKDRLALIDFALDSFASGGFNDFKILQAYWTAQRRY